MKENVLDVLMYLFENYINDEIEFEADEESITTELLDAGFNQTEISKAFAWLEGLADSQNGAVHSHSGSLRVYTDKESEKLDLGCRGFLMYLEQVGVLDHTTRELVIDRIMALESDEIGLEQLKWVTLMVLFNQPGQEAAYTWMEDLVFEPVSGSLH